MKYVFESFWGKESLEKLAPMFCLWDTCASKSLWPAELQTGGRTTKSEEPNQLYHIL